MGKRHTQQQLGTLMATKIEKISFEVLDSCSADAQEQFNENVGAFEQAKWEQPFRVLVESGVSLPPPGELTDSELKDKLWGAIDSLALMGVYLEHTDHLSDRELYLLLWGDVLREEMAIQSGISTLACHVDLIGSGSTEDNDIYLKYYAHDDDRILWTKEFPEEPVPRRESPPFDRDRQLPKPDSENISGIH
jgi:hypothetical protein